jgi:hypothetical protein
VHVRRPTSHSTGAAFSVAFIINLDCRPVNSGVGLSGAGRRFGCSAVVWGRWLAGGLLWVAAVLANTVQAAKLRPTGA